jgi:hypothetical protein
MQAACPDGTNACRCRVFPTHEKAPAPFGPGLGSEASEENAPSTLYMLSIKIDVSL